MGSCCLYWFGLENKVLHVLFGVRQLTDCWRWKRNFLLIRMLLNTGDLHLPLEHPLLASALGPTSQGCDAAYQLLRFYSCLLHCQEKRGRTGTVTTCIL